MARRIKSRKRKFLGHRTYGGGNTKNRRGKGCKGGVGRAGFHKHKWLQTIKRGENINRKFGFHSSRLKLGTVTLEQISRLAAEGKLAKEGNAFVAQFPQSRVVATGELAAPVIVTAAGFSAKARAAIEKAGGKAVDGSVRKKEDAAAAKA